MYKPIGEIGPLLESIYMYISTYVYIYIHMGKLGLFCESGYLYIHTYIYIYLYVHMYTRLSP